jgi:hypothetical protein
MRTRRRRCWAGAGSALGQRHALRKARRPSPALNDPPEIPRRSVHRRRRRCRKLSRDWLPGRHGSTAGPCRDLHFATSGWPLGFSHDWRLATCAGNSRRFSGALCSTDTLGAGDCRWDIPRMLARSACAGQEPRQHGNAAGERGCGDGVTGRGRAIDTDRG